MFYPDIDVRKVTENVLVKRIRDIDRYAFAINNVQNVNVALDRHYQKNYNAFYKMRQKSETWYKIYYSVFEENKVINPSFEKILTELYEKTGRIEASFASKMLATINPKMPVWDKYVLNNLNLKVIRKNKEDRLKNAVNLYYCITEWYKEFLESDIAQNWIQEFNEVLSDYVWFTSTKKVDFILWCAREG